MYRATRDSICLTDPLGEAAASPAPGTWLGRPLDVTDTGRAFDHVNGARWRIPRALCRGRRRGQPATAGHLPPEEFNRWYGGWDPLDPTSIAEFMDGFDRPWWIIGGWSIEAFTGVPRDHEDMDISILSSDAEAFRVFLGDRWTPWNVDDGWFRPFDARFTDVRPDSQVWVRRDAKSPWILDVPFTPDTCGRWTNKRHRDHTENLDDVTWVAPDGLRYARAEVTLMFKAAQARDKDRRDAEVAVPMPDDRARNWLRNAVRCMDPDHAWAEL